MLQNLFQNQSATVFSWRARIQKAAMLQNLFQNQSATVFSWRARIRSCSSLYCSAEQVGWTSLVGFQSQMTVAEQKALGPKGCQNHWRWKSEELHQVRMHWHWKLEELC